MSNPLLVSRRLDTDSFLIVQDLLRNHNRLSVLSFNIMKGHGFFM